MILFLCDFTHLLGYLSNKTSQVYARWGGGGARNIYWWGCALAPPKKGVLGAGIAPKKGGISIGAGTTRKRGS